MKIMIVIPSFEMGGTMVSLHSLLSTWGKNNNFEIKILPLSDVGKYTHKLPNCSILKSSYLTSSLIESKTEIIKNKQYHIKLIFKIIFKLLSYLNIDPWRIIGKIYSVLHSLKNIDIIIAYQEGFTTQFVSNTSITKKIAWIHCNYDYYLSLTKKKPEIATYKKFNKIVCVSNYTKGIFLEIFTMYKHKTITINNILQVNEIKKQSKELIEDIILNDNTFNIISIGRITPVKRLTYIPIIAKFLIDNDIKFHWYIIGGGNDIIEKKNLFNSIATNNCHLHVTYLGETNNPYKFLSKCNIMVSLSFSESFNYVVNESLVVGTPVISTNFGCAEDYIINNYNGLIVDINDIAKSISSVINDKNYYNKLKINCKKHRYSNEKSIIELNKLFIQL